MTKSNGQATDAGEAIKQNGLATAERLRQLAHQARDTAEAIKQQADDLLSNFADVNARFVTDAMQHATDLEAQAEDIAQALLASNTAFAEHVAGYIRSCEQANTAMEQHRAALTKFPVEVDHHMIMVGGGGGGGTRFGPDEEIKQPTDVTARALEAIEEAISLKPPRKDTGP